MAESLTPKTNMEGHNGPPIETDPQAVGEIIRECHNGLLPLEETEDTLKAKLKKVRDQKKSLVTNCCKRLGFKSTQRFKIAREDAMIENEEIRLAAAAQNMAVHNALNVGEIIDWVDRLRAENDGQTPESEAPLDEGWDDGDEASETQTAVQ